MSRTILHFEVTAKNKTIKYTYSELEKAKQIETNKK